MIHSPTSFNNHFVIYKILVEKKKYLLQCKEQLTNKLNKLYKEITILENKVHYIGVTHNNTTNFIMKNNNLIRTMLNSYIDTYNNILNELNKTNYLIESTDISIDEINQYLF